jgi:hypothetical protein
MSVTCESANQPERICVRTQRVFDACMSQFTQENATLPVNSTTVFSRFASGRSVGDGIISNVAITPQPCSVCSRVQYTVQIPIEIDGYDVNDDWITGTTMISIDRDILLKVPTEALIPSTVQVTAQIKCVKGIFNGNMLTTTYCATLITKILAEVELLVQSFGYPALPNCQEYTEEICSGLFTLPIYPK